MNKADLARAAFLFLPLVLLGLLVLPGRLKLRLPLALVIAAVVAVALPLLVATRRPDLCRLLFDDGGDLRHPLSA